MAQHGPVSPLPFAAGRLETTVISALTRMFRVSLASHRRSPRNASLKDVATIRRQLERSIADCPGEPVQRLRKQIHQARSPQELWLLRNDAYQLISQRHNQAVAAERINRLMQFFEGWLEPRQLVRIR